MRLFSRVSCLVLSAGLLVAPLAQATDPVQFSTVTEMFADFNDYPEDDGSFTLIKEKPLEIQLAEPVFQGDADDVVQHELQRAVLYGVYRTFIHTDEPSVTVKAVPMLTTLNPHSSKPLSEPVFEVTVTREQALAAVQEFFPDVEFSDLVTEQYGLPMWSDAFNNLYYAERDPGLEAFYDELEAQADN